MNLDSQEALDNGKVETEQHQRLYSASAPASTNCLLGNFEVNTKQSSESIIKVLNIDNIYLINVPNIGRCIS